METTTKKEYPKLPEPFKTEWLAALRSGDYKQGKATLYNPIGDTFCCLGVAGDICGIPKKEMDGKHLLVQMEEYTNGDKYPDILKATNRPSAPRTAVSELYSKNDGVGNFSGKQWTFLEIADWIEENL